MWDLRRAVQLQQILRGVVDAYCSPSLQRHTGVAAGLDVDRDDRMGLL